MELLEKIAGKLADAGGLGLAVAVLLAVIALMAWAIKRLYEDGEVKSQNCVTDAKEYARGLAAGIATLDATQELVKDLITEKRARR